MSVDPVEIGDEGLGTHGAEQFADAAIAGAHALVERDPDQERWVTPLVRAIKRKRLRLSLLRPHPNIKLWNNPYRPPQQCPPCQSTTMS